MKGNSAIIRLLAVAAFVGLPGCAGQMLQAPTPVSSGLSPVELIDPVAEANADHAWVAEDFFQLAEHIRQANKPKQLPPVRNVLVLSGGGAYGAYSAGILVGWSEAGTRPMFDVVTGISTGALIAPLVFLGPQYDDQMKTLYTTLSNDDVFKIRRSIRTLLGEGLADNRPLAAMIEKLVTPQLLKEIAAEHAKGRRLFVGTTDLESRRGVQWDMGELATRGTPDDLELFRKLLLASSAIPGFFPPVKLPVTVDGAPYTERHIDGGVTHALFFRPPHLTDEQKKNPLTASLYGSNVYAIVAGKLYADAEVVSPRLYKIAASSVSTLIYSQTRGDLLKLYMACMLTGMNYKMTAIPQAYAAPTSSTEFDPVEMSKMFNEALAQVKAGTAWRDTPPGLERGEGIMLRAGPRLTRVDLASPKLKPKPSGVLPWINEMLNGGPVVQGDSKPKRHPIKPLPVVPVEAISSDQTSPNR